MRYDIHYITLGLYRDLKMVNPLDDDGFYEYTFESILREYERFHYQELICGVIIGWF